MIVDFYGQMMETESPPNETEEKQDHRMQYQSNKYVKLAMLNFNKLINNCK